jgi:hypothetical protein
MVGVFEDVVLLALVVFFVPLGILSVGTPIVLCARLGREIWRRL